MYFIEIDSPSHGSIILNLSTIGFISYDSKSSKYQIHLITGKVLYVYPADYLELTARIYELDPFLEEQVHRRRQQRELCSTELGSTELGVNNKDG